MPEKLSRMIATINWQNEIGDIAGRFEGNRKGWLARAARRANISCRQVKALYYGETTNPRHDVATSVLTAAQQARLEEARRDALMVADIYRGAAEALTHKDEDFYRHDIDALVTAARIVGGRDRT